MASIVAVYLRPIEHTNCFRTDLISRVMIRK